MSFQFVIISDNEIARLELCSSSTFLFSCDTPPQTNEFDELIAKRYNLTILSKENIDDFFIIETDQKFCYNIKWLKFSSFAKFAANKTKLKELYRFLKVKLNKNSVKLQYGLRNDEIVSIFDLDPNEERGLNCNCICPGCHDILLAKMGNKNIPHFAHKNAECDIKVAHETALHIMAKDIIQEYKTMSFPPMYIEFVDTNLYKNLSEEKIQIYKHHIRQKFEAITSKNVFFDTISLEKKVSDVIPDIVATKNGRICLIEIAVYHKIDKEKAKKIFDLNLPTIEIDLSEFTSKQFNKNSLKELIINSIENKSWIHNPKLNSKAKEAENFYQKLIEEVDNQLEIESEFQRQQEKEFQIQQEKELRKERERLEAPKLLEAALEPHAYKNRILSLINNKRFEEIYKNSCLYDKSKKPPFYLDIPIYGEFIFNCDRRIWQTLLFEKFIFKRKTCDLRFSKIMRWLLNHQSEFEVNWKYAYKVFVNGKIHLLLPMVINRYLDFLEFLGFIEYHRKNELDDAGFGTVIVPNKITPPDRENAYKVQKALESIDKYSHDSEAKIYAFWNQ